MLQEIKVSQFAIIDSLHVEFQSGLNILSGETGSGKSVLLKSLSLLMGDKAHSDTIRTGCSTATVEGVFNLKYRPDLKNKFQDFDIPLEDNQLIVRRVLSSEDKSRVYLNGVLSSLSQLRELVAPLIEVTGQSAPLIEMTGQHDNRHLISKKYHLDLVDQYAQCGEKRLNYETQFQNYTQLKSEITKFENDLDKNLSKLDFLKYQVSEFQKLNLNTEEDTKLEADIKALKSSSRWINYTELCNQLIYEDEGSISERLKVLIKKSIDLSQNNPDLEEKVKSLEKASELISDFLYDLNTYTKKLNLSPEILEDKEARLSQIKKLEKKHGKNITELADFFNHLQKEISQLENAEDHLNQIKKQLSLFESELKRKGSDLHKIREKASKELSKKVNSELNDLNMKGVTFDIQCVDTTEIGPHGTTDVEFLSQTSPKDPKKPLSKVSSGGELSRILLALKTAVGQVHTLQDLPRTYLFDEVDTGVSGQTAEKVGKKLKQIAQGQQVICVTHLPQVAACGDVHFSIQKNTVKGLAQMTVTELNKKDRIEEIAKLISGEKITKTSLAHAEQLISDFKK